MKGAMLPENEPDSFGQKGFKGPRISRLNRKRENANRFRIGIKGLCAESRSKKPTDEATGLASAPPGRPKGVRYPLRTVSPVPQMRRAQPGLGSIGFRWF